MNKFFKIISVVLVVFTVYLTTLYFMQNYLLFYPSKKYKSPTDISLAEFSENLLTAEDNTKIMSWYHEGDKNKPAILFLHGNAGQIATFAPHLLPLTKAGYAVLMMEYRGFGNTKGSISQQTVVKDAALAFDWLKSQGYPEIVVYGYSFGTAFSSALTDIRPVDRLILTAPFSALDKLVSEKPVPFAKFALKDKYKSTEYLKKYSAPLLIIHGKKDKLIPYHHAQMLFEVALSEKKQIELLDDEAHASVFFEEKNIPFILKFLEKETETIDMATPPEFENQVKNKE